MQSDRHDHFPGLTAARQQPSHLPFHKLTGCCHIILHNTRAASAQGTGLLEINHRHDAPGLHAVLASQHSHLTWGLNINAWTNGKARCFKHAATLDMLSCTFIGIQAVSCNKIALVCIMGERVACPVVALLYQLGVFRITVT